MQGDKLEPLMRQAGFVDLQLRIVNIEIGEWAKGMSDFLVIYYDIDISDARWHHVARVARDVWGDGLVAYAETLGAHYGSEQEHLDFVRSVKLDMQNLDYQMIVSMYSTTLMLD